MTILYNIGESSCTLCNKQKLTFNIVRCIMAYSKDIKMNIWYLLKCWLKILMIARQEKVNTNVVMSKILKSNNSLESLPFLPFYRSI